MPLIKRAPGAGRPKKYGEDTRSLRVPVSITTEQIMGIADLQMVLDHWEAEVRSNPDNPRHYFLKQMIDEIRALGYWLFARASVDCFWLTLVISFLPV